MNEGIESHKENKQIESKKKRRKVCTIEVKTFLGYILSPETFVINDCQDCIIYYTLNTALTSSYRETY